MLPFIAFLSDIFLRKLLGYRRFILFRYLLHCFHSTVYISH